MRVLLVDDNSQFASAATRFLSLIGQLHVVGHARSGREALEQVNRLQPDLVLMDVMMPDMDGLEATRHLKESHASARIVILTLHDSAEYRARAREVGADAFVSKEEFGTALLDVIDRLGLGEESAQ